MLHPTPELLQMCMISEAKPSEISIIEVGIISFSLSKLDKKSFNCYKGREGDYLTEW